MARSSKRPEPDVHAEGLEVVACNAGVATAYVPAGTEVLIEGRPATLLVSALVHILDGDVTRVNLALAEKAEALAKTKKG